MAHGGKRTGAGRKAGAEAKKTKQRRAVARKAVAEGITPLDVMLFAMRRLFEAKDYAAAAAVAKDAAPYSHPRLSAVALSGKVGVLLEVVEEIVDAPAG